MGKRKKYNPIKEINKITGSLVATSFGTMIPYQVAGAMPSGVGKTIALQGLAAPTRMMPMIPLVQTSGSLLRSLEMLDVKPYKKRRKRR